VQEAPLLRDQASRPLHNPQGLIAELKASTSPYPDMLREALLKEFLWEVKFSIENGEKAIARGDQTYVAGCAYRALSCVAQVLFALNRRYLINEKGALSEAADFPCTIPGLLNRTTSVWATICGLSTRNCGNWLRPRPRHATPLRSR
jgi:hypothetical protein